MSDTPATEEQRVAWLAETLRLLNLEEIEDSINLLQEEGFIHAAHILASYLHLSTQPQEQGDG